ncbi:M48 family metalloprotease [uncultured Sphingomonas sp.]|uniref:M48 family metalloprotease n=1 Tax=uncultured Sphingomonas sp. TaxID=158754 RepID=UPI0035C97FA8
MRQYLPLALLLSTPAFAQSDALQSGRVAPITAQERQQGATTNASLTAEYGGALTGRQATYVEQVGRRVATRSGLSASPTAFNVTLLDSPLDNAFAIPGGYVYVTRNLVTLMNDEAELAAILGHEVAHVAARHSQRRQSTAQRNSVLGALGQAIVGAVTGNSTVGGLLGRGIGAGAQLATLGFSRGQETESDNLGVRYLASAGYDPLALSTMLESLADQTALQGELTGRAQSATPRWASTHPDPGSRVRNAEAQAARVAPAGATPAAARNRDVFLSAIDGMMYGENPRQGVVEGRRFLHPDLGLAFEVPQGFTLSNTTRSVRIAGQGAQAEFSAAPFSGDLNAYVASVVRTLGANASAPAERMTVNGIPVAYTQFRAASGQTQVGIVVFAYQLSATQAVHFTAIGQSAALEPAFGSLRRLPRAESAAIRPRFVRVTTVRAGDTPDTLSRRMAYPDAQLDRFLVLNRLAPNEPLRPGEKVKLVTY